MNRDPTFNLWLEAWMEVERLDGSLALLSVEALLYEANTIRRLYDPSPLVGVAAHRLLVAILQDALRPQTVEDLIALWRGESFPREPLDHFGSTFAHRFDLFSPTEPFLQSGDLPLAPAKKSDAKPVGYLFPELPAVTAVTHYTHVYDETTPLCARCAAKGLLLIPPFASSGGSGIKPSINGVPPIYVVPNLSTLYQQLVASLVTPPYQPKVADHRGDTPWWRREPSMIEKKGERLRVGYGDSLTFPARRVRLHPEPMTAPCLRCDAQTLWNARTMIYEMGESRPKDAPFWQDPFAAYRESKKGEPPTPVRPFEDRAIWREFATLFLPTRSAADAPGHRRPRVLDQLDELWQVMPDLPEIPLRTVGLRTDGKMKIFEWEESDFTLSPALLDDLDAAAAIPLMIDFATEVNRIIRRMFVEHFGGGTKEKRYEGVLARLSQRYWEELEPPFRTMILRFGGVDTDALKREWAALVVRHAQGTFEKTVEQLARDATTLRKQVEGEDKCWGALQKHLTTKYPKEGAI